MGVHGQMSNRTRSKGHKKIWRLHRLKRAEKKRVHGQTVGDVADPELITVHHLKKRRTSPRANITLSGKKRRKLLKQLKHMQTEKNQMEISTEISQPKNKKKKTDEDMKSPKPEESMTQDIDMAE